MPFWSSEEMLNSLTYENNAPFGALFISEQIDYCYCSKERFPGQNNRTLR